MRPIHPLQALLIISALAFFPFVVQGDLELVAPSDQATPRDGSVTDAKVNASGITTRSKLPAPLAYEDEANIFTANQQLDKTGIAISTLTQKDSYDSLLRGSFWNGTAEVTHDFKLRDIASTTVNEQGRLGILWDGTEILSVLSTGKVGINRSNPVQAFEVASTGNTALTIDTSNATGQARVKLNREGTNRFEYGLDVNGNGTNDFYIHDYTRGVTPFYISSIGDIGFNTTSPAGRCHIVGGADVKQLVVRANLTQTANIMEVQNSAGTPLVMIDGSGDFLLKQYEDISQIATPANPGVGTRRLFVDSTDGVLKVRTSAGTSVSLEAGGGGAPVDASYVTTAAEAGLTAEKVLGTDVILAGLDASKPVAGTSGRLYFATDTGVIYRDNATTWVAWVPDATAAVLGKIQLAGQLGGTAASPDVRGLRETGGPTFLTMSQVANGQFLTRSGTTITGSAATYTYDSRVTNVQVVNTTIETQIEASSITGGNLGNNRALRMILLGDYLNNSGAGSTLTIRVKYGATTIGTFSMGSIAASANYRNFMLDFIMSIDAGTSSQRAEGLASLGGATANEVVGSASSAPTFQQSMHNACAEDSTVTKNFAVTVQHGTAATTIEFNARIYRLELM